MLGSLTVATVSTLVLLTAAIVAGVLLLRRRKEGIIVDWVCPEGKGWGWGPIGYGKCCDKDGTGSKRCVAPVPVDSEGATGDLLNFKVRNQQLANESDADLAARGLVRDPVTKEVVSQKTLDKRMKERKRRGETLPPAPGVKGKRCEGTTKPSQCPGGYKVKCQASRLSGTYAWRCCKKSGERYVCDDEADSLQVRGGSATGTVPTRVDGDKCPPGTAKNGSKCELFDQEQYNAWFDRFYVPRAKDGNCPVGTTGSYRFKDGSTNGQKCQVLDENKYKGWKSYNAGKWDAGVYKAEPWAKVSWEGCDYTSQQERVDGKWECPGTLSTGLTPEKNGSEWGKYQCAPSQQCKDKILKHVKGGRYDTPKITVYEDTEFKGDSKDYAQGAQVPSLRDEQWNDRISSIKVQNTKVTLYENDNYGGRSVTLDAGDWDLTKVNMNGGKRNTNQCAKYDGGCWQDMPSSLKVG